MEKDIERLMSVTDELLHNLNGIKRLLESLLEDEQGNVPTSGNNPILRLDKHGQDRSSLDEKDK